MTLVIKLKVAMIEKLDMKLVPGMLEVPVKISRVKLM